MPFLPDGDTYFHGMMTNYIVEYGETTTYTPYEVPLGANGAPMSFQILTAQIHLVTGIPVVTIMRWFGPVMSGVICLVMYILLKRLTNNRVTALLGSLVMLFVPYYNGRLSATFPENVLMLFIPVLIYLLHDAVENRNRNSLVATLLITASAVGFHFSSYMLLLLYGIGVLLYFVGRRWQHRNVLYISLFGLGLIGVISVVFSNWWLFGFLKSLFQTHSGAAFLTDTTYTLAAPTTSLWSGNIGVFVIILSLIGFLVLLLRRQTLWRTKVLLLGYTFIVLLPLQILPAMKLFSYTPFRAFAYISIPLVLIAGYAIDWFLRLRMPYLKVFAIGALLILLIPHYTAPTVKGAGEQHLTKSEYVGLEWLQEHTTNMTLVITAPANGRQIAFYTKNPISYNTSYGVFYAQDAKQAILEAQKLGTFDQVYIYISKYKLGPVYNYGWVRDYAYVNANLQKFKNEKYFSKVFEDEDSLIYVTPPTGS